MALEKNVDGVKYLKTTPGKDEGPEVASIQDFPEVVPEQPPPEVYQPSQPSYTSSPHPESVSPIQRENSTYGSAYGSYNTTQSPYGGTRNQHTAYAPGGEPLTPTKSRTNVCGCSLIVFILSVIIAVLAVAVIGLAAGTGVEASRANDALVKLTALEATASAKVPATTTVTVTSAPTTTSFASLTNNCSNKDEKTTGTSYTTDFFGKVTFTMFCNSNAPNPPLMSLFTANFNNCMDACAAFTSYEPGFDGNATCVGVSFIPLWTTRQAAVAGTAPGNCYLKPGPQTRAGLETPNIGTECHAAIISSS
ncbi:hypothetical protein CCHL11_01277 [Colletotrichum chlorophyti]|uniref:Apple domain-containing protein n=1 Tax=Colletotrichum chlorophyti TaxID=708187 RepID=A0A1Q8S864_9PEZI|nr:hypothetical protein CCHL11_01277 [Colletotrichum chlorophyti]